MFENTFEGAPVARRLEREALQDFGVTTDILSYRICPRHYGFFKHRHFKAAATTPLFYGKTIHQTLDFCHYYFKGQAGNANIGEVPPLNVVHSYFRQVERALKAQGITSVNRVVRNRALAVIQVFNLLLGEYTYPKVEDTECHLRSVRIPRGAEDPSERYVIGGVVDVILDDEGKREIWDYKGGSMDPKSLVFRHFELQIKGYAHLYEKKVGIAPSVGRVLFLGSLARLVEEKLGKRLDGFLFNEVERGGEVAWNLDAAAEIRERLGGDPQTLLPEISHAVPFVSDAVEDALAFFDDTVKEIRGELIKPFAEQWRVEENERPPGFSCVHCELKFSCPHHDESVPPPLS
ncbi:MAG: hypothetical protein Kow0069_11050 [Promethearchaeota archaeon]